MAMRAGPNPLDAEAVARLSASLQAPSQQDLRASVLAHPLLALSLPTSSALGLQIEELRSKLASQRDQLETDRQQATEQLDLATKNIQQFRDSLDALPGQVETLENEIDDVHHHLVTKPSESSQSPLRQELKKQRATITSFQSARDYFAIVGEAQRLWDAALAEDKEKPKTVTANDLALRKLAELSNLYSFAEKLVKDLHGYQSSSAPTLRILPFIRGKLQDTYEQLVGRRCKDLREALEAAEWPPLSPEQAQEQGKTTRSPDGILSDDRVQASWTELTSLQVVGALLNLASLPTCWQQKDVGDLCKPGSASYTALLSTQVLLEPYLLRFRFHFDSSRATNRLDKPEWYLNHMLSLAKTLLPLFSTSPRGPALRLSAVALHRYGQAFNATPQSEIIHTLLRPLVAKVDSSTTLLLDQRSSQLLAHTVSSLISFDDDLAELLTSSRLDMEPFRLSDGILSKDTWFDSWVKGERASCEETIETVLEDGDAWTIVSAEGDDGDEDEAPVGSWAAAASASGASKTTRSSRSLVLLVQGITNTYKSLPQLWQRLQFLTEIQLPMLRIYHQRISRSLDAFESLSSAFARAIPGGIEPGTGLPSADADMVRVLRGLSRLLKAYLSAAHVHKYLLRWQAESLFLEMSHEVLQSKEGAELMKQQRDEAEDQELTGESLGSLIRKGLRSARPLQSSSSSSSNTTSTAAASIGKGHQSIWDEPLQKFSSLSTRALSSIRRLIHSEIEESLRPYSQMSWSDSVLSTECPTPSLMPALSTLHVHLTHSLPSLHPVAAARLYHTLAKDVSSTIVHRVVIVGGSRRFTAEGAQRFRNDVMGGWLTVVNQVAKTLSTTSLSSPSNNISAAVAVGRPTLSPMGYDAAAPWRYLHDVSLLLALPSSSSSSSGSVSAQTNQGWTLAKATMAAWSPDEGGRGQQLQVDDSWQRMTRELKLVSTVPAGVVDGESEVILTRQRVREVLSRRVESLR